MSNICEHCHGTGKNVDHKAIGNAFRQRRESADIGLRELARKVDICPAYLSRLERGMAVWHLKVMVRVDEALS